MPVAFQEVPEAVVERTSAGVAGAGWLVLGFSLVLELGSDLDVGVGVGRVCS